MKKIACFVGGGIKGIVSAQIVNQIELETAKPFVDQFDIISGTSTGSIIATMLSEGYSGKEIVELFGERGADIFKSSRNFISRMYKPKYDISNLAEVLDDYLPDKRVSDVDKNLMLFSANKSKVEPKVFKSWKNKGYSLKDAVLASSAAPTFFKSAGNFTDGGVWANDPSIETYAQVQDFKTHHEKVKCLTIGTGYNPNDLSGKGSGFIYWGKNIVPFLMEIQQRRSEYVMNKLLADDYLKLNPILESASSDMDDASTDNIKALLKDSARFIHQSPEFKKYKEII